METKNLKDTLTKLVSRYETVLINNARVKTGRLRDSIRAEIVYSEADTNVLMRMMDYGVYERVWKDLRTPVMVWKEFFTDNEMTQLGQAISKDILTDINAEIELIKKQ